MWLRRLLPVAVVAVLVWLAACQPRRTVWGPTDTRPVAVLGRAGITKEMVQTLREHRRAVVVARIKKVEVSRANTEGRGRGLVECHYTLIDDYCVGLDVARVLAFKWLAHYPAHWPARRGELLVEQKIYLLILRAGERVPFIERHVVVNEVRDPLVRHVEGWLREAGHATP